MSVIDERFCFIAEWYDPNAALIRRYQFFYYPTDATTEMYDIKQRRIFLRRSPIENIKMQDLYLGSTISVMSRQLSLVEYGDDYTRRKVGAQKERTLALIKPDAVSKMGLILDIIYKSGLLITKMKMLKISRTEAADFYTAFQDKDHYNDLINSISDGLMIAMELRGECAMSRWLELVGPGDSTVARHSAPLSLRARFGKDHTRNAVHGSDNQEQANQELEFFFPSSGPVRRNPATYTECTCCVIKPHAVKAGVAGTIVNAILEAGFEISAIAVYQMEKANAQEFYEVYRGVVQEYSDMVDELSLGPCLALEIRAQNAPVTFREMAGPTDPEIARHLRPRSLRAQFGIDKVHNAIHCTDLPEDAVLEVEYFFKILDH
ncbi:Nucleoside diphosphate kinase 7 [Lamellibrachia satsuma]|nr:Nucleoside diphosphate kinase 7 [Lamellibrachia satsuma]